MTRALIWFRRLICKHATRKSGFARDPMKSPVGWGQVPAEVCIACGQLFIENRKVSTL